MWNTSARLYLFLHLTFRLEFVDLQRQRTTQRRSCEPRPLAQLPLTGVMVQQEFLF